MIAIRGILAVLRDIMIYMQLKASLMSSQHESFSSITYRKTVPEIILALHNSIYENIDFLLNRTLRGNILTRFNYPLILCLSGFLYSFCSRRLVHALRAILSASFVILYSSAFVGELTNVLKIHGIGRCIWLG